MGRIVFLFAECSAKSRAMAEFGGEKNSIRATWKGFPETRRSENSGLLDVAVNNTLA